MLNTEDYLRVCESINCVDEYIEPGAEDNHLLYFKGIGCKDSLANKVITLLEKISRRNFINDKNEISSIIKEYKTINIVEQVFEKIIESKPNLLMCRHISNYARDLIHNETNNELIKFGISLLGITGGNNKDLERLKELALQEEYTLFCILSICSLVENYENIIWDIAKRTFYWGRINCIRKLRNTNSSEIKKWLLYEGYQNAVKIEYTAIICAISGELKQELSKAYVGREVVKAATEIINSLLGGYLINNMDDYYEAPSVFAHYIKHVEKTGNVREYATLIRILQYLSNNSINWDKKIGWRYSYRNDLIELIEFVLDNKIWDNNFSLSNFEEEDIILVAHYYNLDLWDLSFKKLKSNPLNSIYWSNAICFLNKERIEIIIEYAKKALPWSSILKNGEGYPQNALEEIIEGMCKFPASGSELLLLLLRSRIGKYREFAIKILKSWGEEFWPSGTLKSLNISILREDDPEKKEILLRLINKIN